MFKIKNTCFEEHHQKHKKMHKIWEMSANNLCFKGLVFKIKDL